MLEKIYSLFVLSMLFFEFLQIFLILFAKRSCEEDEIYEEDSQMYVDKTVDDKLKSGVKVFWKRDHLFWI